jgi:hypothetical protein
MAIDPLSLAGPVQQGQGVAGQYVYWMCMPHPLEETVAERGVICESSSGIYGVVWYNKPHIKRLGGAGGAPEETKETGEQPRRPRIHRRQTEMPKVLEQIVLFDTHALRSWAEFQRLRATRAKALVIVVVFGMLARSCNEFQRQRGSRAKSIGNHCI